jgi:hypothetical protein
LRGGDEDLTGVNLHQTAHEFAGKLATARVRAAAIRISKLATTCLTKKKLGPFFALPDVDRYEPNMQ